MTTAAARAGGEGRDDAACEALDRLRARVDGWKLGDDREVSVRMELTNERVRHDNECLLLCFASRDEAA
jgi:hypothetical protein